MTAYASWTYLEDRERGHLEGLLAALASLDGHGFRDTAHDRVRRLLACDECGHQPHQHGEQSVCTAGIVSALGGLAQCACIEWEPPWTTAQKPEGGAR